MVQQRIGVVGEYQPDFAPHTAIEMAVHQRNLRAWGDALGLMLARDGR